MKLVEINKNQIERANNLYNFNKLNGSITKGKSNIYGALGEIIVYDLFVKNNYKVIFKSNYDYDMIINGHKIDVKTKKTNFIPKMNYLCSISSFNTKQECDYYFFVRINQNFKEAYVLGYKSKASFFKESFYKNKDDLDINGFVFKDNCYNIEISKLNKFKNLL